MLGLRWLEGVGLRSSIPFDDADIVFIMPVYRDAAVAERSLSRLRRNYPGSRLVLISDGDADFPGEDFARRFAAEYELGENLYALHHGGQMVHRLLEVYMRAPARVLVRLDSDARIDRRFAGLPRRPGLYGTIGRRSRTVQGGCILLTQAAAARLYESRVFLSEALLDPEASWGGLQHAREPAAQARPAARRLRQGAALGLRPGGRADPRVPRDLLGMEDLPRDPGASGERGPALRDRASRQAAGGRSCRRRMRAVPRSGRRTSPRSRGPRSW